MNTISKVMELSVEVITLPESDVERALRFYVDRVGFALDVDYSPNEAFRVVQLTAGIKLPNTDRTRTYRRAGWITSQSLSCVGPDSSWCPPARHCP